MPRKKNCTRCGKMLPLTDFSPCAHGKYGRYCRCKKCHALLARVRRAKKSQRERIRQSQQAWRARNRAVAAAAVRRWKRRHPGKVSAHHAVRAAVLGGLLDRPDRCEQCGHAGRGVASPLPRAGAGASPLWLADNRCSGILVPIASAEKPTLWLADNRGSGYGAVHAEGRIWGRTGAKRHCELQYPTGKSSG